MALGLATWSPYITLRLCSPGHMSPCPVAYTMNNTSDLDTYSTTASSLILSPLLPNCVVMMYWVYVPMSPMILSMYSYDWYDPPTTSSVIGMCICYYLYLHEYPLYHSDGLLMRVPIPNLLRRSFHHKLPMVLVTVGNVIPVAAVGNVCARVHLPNGVWVTGCTGDRHGHHRI